MIFTFICDMCSVLHRQQLPSLLSTRDEPRVRPKRGSIFGRRSGISFQPSLTAAAVNACSALRTPIRTAAGDDRAFH
jgi:hypothetical protein